ncbi:MAG: class A beta-lactamase-related serine hydrolase, partial [Acidimicrobiia bacterium]|nr:class A beta-lactamase-related serine hydrolase [Acidimicrobiia bacterium]
MRPRLVIVLALAVATAIPGVAASAQGTPSTVKAPVQDDVLQITLDRLHAEATSFFGPDSRSISVIRLDDGSRASAAGDVWHISLSAAKAIWVVAAVQAAGADAVQPYASPIFRRSNNGSASLVISLVGPAPSKGVDAINATTWSWGLENTYLYAWFNSSGTGYGYHLSSKPLPNAAVPTSINMWIRNNFTTTDDQAGFWAMLANGELLDEADTARVLGWGALPRSHEGNELITNRLPAAVAAGVSHKSGWNGDTSAYLKSRRIDGGVVTAPNGVRYAIAVSFRTPYPAQVDAGGANWARYASCEVYNVIAETGHECTRSGDPASIRNHTLAPIGSLSWARAERDQLRVSGSALDRDSGADPIDVRITVDGTAVGTITADLLKTSVHHQHGTGNYHGFGGEFAVKLSPGPHQVCAIAINDSGTGSNPTVGCRTAKVPDDYPPIGNLPRARLDGTRIVARGWAEDLDTEGPILVRLLVDGRKIQTIRADRGAGGHVFLVRRIVHLEPGD